MRRIIAIILTIAALLFVFTGCSFNRCEDCGNTPTKGFKNSATNEQMYYCKDCYTNCAFCSQKATKHYTNLLEMIMFVCKDCYADIAG